MDQQTADELAQLRAEVAQLREQRIPLVDRSSRRRDRRLTYAYVLATAVAVAFASLGSASALDGTNTVFTDDIVANAVTGPKILDGTITSLDVRDGAVGSVDVRDGSIGTTDIADGSVGSVDIKDGTVESADLAGSATAPHPVLRSGQTMRGLWAAATGGYRPVVEAITFPQQLPATFDVSHVEFVDFGTPVTANCPARGSAAPGWVCVYAHYNNYAEFCCFYGEDHVPSRVSPNGFRMHMTSGQTNGYTHGSWAATAP